MTAYIKKECMELTRTGKLLILGIIFILFGILNPAMAKLTPWLYEMLQDSFSEQGLIIGEVTVNAMTSWTQYFKNATMVVITIILLCSTGFTNEYQKGTLVQIVTKGLSRRKIYFSKLLVGYATWTVMFLVYTGVTLGYTVYFWGDDKVPDLFYAILFFWIFGILLMSLLSMFGALSENSGQVLLGTGGIIFITILINYVPTISKYMPIKLMDGLQLCNGTAQVSDFSEALIITSIMIIACIIIGMVAFDKRRL
ncbi:MAG: ABC transporter permease subunit [Lachnospiraceae bacterium]|nr:ABC transporter permease subunit [Lachnospiraceae bacterium]